MLQMLLFCSLYRMFVHQINNKTITTELEKKRKDYEIGLTYCLRWRQRTRFPYDEYYVDFEAERQNLFAK